MREYEFVALYHPDLEIDLEMATKKVEKIITDNGGKIVSSDNWGKRKLAYTIAKQNYAVYVVSKIELPAEKVAKVESVLNITSEVIRYIITNPVPEVEEDEKEQSSKEEAKEKESEE